MYAKYHHDAVSPTFYGALDYEAWGGEVIFSYDGPPNAGTPLAFHPEDITRLAPPTVNKTACLIKALNAITLMKRKVGNEIPILGQVISPFSLPVMQLGFDHYFDVLYGRPDLFNRLIAMNEQFCVEWANAQLEAGATAIGYADPISSTTIIPRELYLKTGFLIAKRTLAQIKGAVATAFASGRCLPILADVAQTGTVGVSVSSLEDLSEIKAACKGRLAVLGNLNAIEMRRWTPAEAEAAVKTAIAKAGPDGGYLLSDNHGEIPWQVPETTLLAVTEAVHRWGHYPLTWVQNHDCQV